MFTILKNVRKVAVVAVAAAALVPQVASAHGGGGGGGGMGGAHMMAAPSYARAPSHVSQKNTTVKLPPAAAKLPISSRLPVAFNPPTTTTPTLPPSFGKIPVGSRLPVSFNPPVSSSPAPTNPAPTNPAPTNPTPTGNGGFGGFPVGLGLGLGLGSFGGYGGYGGGSGGGYGGSGGGYSGGTSAPVAAAPVATDPANSSPTTTAATVAQTDGVIQASYSQVIGTPDLVVEDIRMVEPATVVAGPAYRVTFRNQGSAAASSFRVGLFAAVDSRLSDSRAVVDVAGLAAGQSAEVTLRLPQSSLQLVSADGHKSGFDKLAVMVDVDQKVQESDKSNNAVVVDRSVLEAAR